MGGILLKAASFVAIIALGYLLKRIGFFGAEDYKIPLKLVMNVTMPCAAVVSFATNPPALSLLLAVILGFGLNCVMLAIACFASKRTQRNVRSVWLNCVPGFNIGAFAMPFIQSFLGPAGLVGTCLFDTGSALMCNGTTYAISLNILDGTKGLKLKQLGNTLLHSVPFLTYFFLLIITLIGLPIPDTVVKLVTPAANANAFLAMMMVGMMFDLHIEKALVRQIGKILLLRYAISAAAAAVFYFCLPLPAEIRQALCIAVFAPASITSTGFAVKAGGDPAVAAGVNSLSILICIVCTLTLLTVFGAV